MSNDGQNATIPDVPPEIRDQIERFMSDPMRCMPSERERLEQMGFGTKETPEGNAPCPKNIT